MGVEFPRHSSGLINQYPRIRGLKSAIFSNSRAMIANRIFIKRRYIARELESLGDVKCASFPTVPVYTTQCRKDVRTSCWMPPSGLPSLASSHSFLVPHLCFPFVETSTTSNVIIFLPVLVRKFWGIMLCRKTRVPSCTREIESDPKD